MKIKSKKDYMIDFFKDKKNHNREFTLSEYDSEVKKAFEAATGTNKIYTNRTPRNLIRYGDPELDGILKRTKRGNYIFHPGEKFVIKKSPFSDAIKKKIKKRDKYTCQWCGKKETKLDILAVDHLEPEASGGKGVYENGITLCNVCNNRKKNLKISSFGLNMFKKYLEKSKINEDKKGIKFLEDIIKVYNKHKLS